MEELETEIEKCKNYRNGNLIYADYSGITKLEKAIEIVKRGGKE